MSECEFNSENMDRMAFNTVDGIEYTYGMGTWKLCQQPAMFGLRIPKYRDKRFINKRNEPIW